MPDHSLRSPARARGGRGRVSEKETGRKSCFVAVHRRDGGENDLLKAPHEVRRGLRLLKAVWVETVPNTARGWRWTDWYRIPIETTLQALCERLASCSITDGPYWGVGSVGIFAAGGMPDSSVRGKAASRTKEAVRTIEEGGFWRGLAQALFGDDWARTVSALDPTLGSNLPNSFMSELPSADRVERWERLIKRWEKFPACWSHVQNGLASAQSAIMSAMEGAEAAHEEWLKRALTLSAWAYRESMAGPDLSGHEKQRVLAEAQLCYPRP